MSKLRLAVLMGGRSPEHEISVISGREVANNLSRKRYKVIPIVISKDGKRWQKVSLESLNEIDNPLSYKGTSKELIRSIEVLNGLSELVKICGCVFVAMHGPCGEDGTIQGTLELAGIPYTGCGVLASALGMDKVRFRMILESQKIKHPEYIALRKNSSITAVTKKLGGPPYFVKPHNQGSSVGVSLVKYKKDLNSAVRQAHEFSECVLVDKFLQGKEITCAVMGNDKPIALPLVEIIPLRAEFFDYDSKYTSGGAEEIVPARIPKDLTKQIQDLAVAVYKLVGCRGFARIDFIITGKRIVYVLEINTIPGLTPMSLFPKSAKAYGLTYTSLLDKIIKYAIE